MLPDRLSNPGPLTYESGALPIALRGPAKLDLVLNYIKYMDTNCAPIVADLFCSVMTKTSCCLFQMITSLKVLKLSSLLLGILMTYCILMITSSALQYNYANTSDNETSFEDLYLPISDGFVKNTIFDKRDDFDFDIVHFPFLDGDIPRSTPCVVYISHFICLARVSSHVDDLNTCKSFDSKTSQSRK